MKIIESVTFNKGGSEFHLKHSDLDISSISTAGDTIFIPLTSEAIQDSLANIVYHMSLLSNFGMWYDIHNTYVSLAVNQNETLLHVQVVPLPINEHIKRAEIRKALATGDEYLIKSEASIFETIEEYFEGDVPRSSTACYNVALDASEQELVRRLCHILRD